MERKHFRFNMGEMLVRFSADNDEEVARFFTESTMSNADTVRLLFAEHLDLAEKDKTISDLQKQLEEERDKSQNENLKLRNQILEMENQIAALKEKNAMQEALSQQQMQLFRQQMQAQETSHQQQMQMFLQFAAGGFQAMPTSSAPAAVTAVQTEMTATLAPSSDLVKESSALSEEEEEARRVEERKRKQEEQRRKREEKERAEERQRIKRAEAEKEAFYTPSTDENGAPILDSAFFAKTGFNLKEYKKYPFADMPAYFAAVDLFSVPDDQKKEYLTTKIDIMSGRRLPNEKVIRDILTDEELDWMLNNLDLQSYPDSAKPMYFRSHRDFNAYQPKDQEILADFLLSADSAFLKSIGLNAGETGLGLVDPVRSVFLQRQASMFKRFRF